VVWVGCTNVISVWIEPRGLPDHHRLFMLTRPDAMTTLSTHDTKRSEDVRARLAVLTEKPMEWSILVEELERATLAHRGDRVDGATALLLWQVLAACSALPGSDAQPLTTERLDGYLLKAVRAAKVHSTWTEQDEDYEQQV